MASRRCASPTRPSIHRPCPSGPAAPGRPACARARPRRAAPSSRSSPAKPHISSAPSASGPQTVIRRSASSTRRRNSASCSGRSISPRRATARRAGAARSSPSIPSITPSGDQATGPQPPPSRSMPWWWNELTGSSTLPSTCARSESGAMRTPCVVTSPGSCWRWLTEPSVTSGRCWNSVPPRATLSACMPRQMPRIGSPTASAARATASSKASRRGPIGPSSGCGGAP